MKAPSANIQDPRKHQAPSSKLQRSIKHQTLIPNLRAFEIGLWNLELLWCLDVGAWSFVSK
jgi:hypothetical protein